MPYPSGFPDAPLADRPYSEVLLDALWKHYSDEPNRPALISAEDSSVCLTYGDLYLKTLSIAAFLEKFHFDLGDVAALVMQNCWEYFAIYVATTLQGGAISGASVLFTDYELERQFSDSNCKVVFCADKSIDRVLKAARKCKNIKVIIEISTQKYEKTDYPFGVYSFEEVLQTQPNFNRKKLNHDIKKDLLLLPYSSGTTGPPKGVMLSHFNFGTMINIVTKHLDEQVMTQLDPNWKWEKEVFLLVLPFYHIYGFGVLNNTIIRGSTGVIMSHFDQEVFCRSIQKYRCRIIMVAPPILLFLAKNPIVSKYDLSSLEFLMSGAAPSGKDLIEEVYRRLPNVRYICQAYGMTECGMTSHFPILDRDHYASAGRLLSNFQQKIVDIETGEEVPIGQKGEVYLKTPSNMVGYLNRPDATAESLSPDNWLKTGDIGYLDKDGWLYIVDRLKELIKVRGFQVAPAELEDLLLSHPEIQDCAVIGIPDEKSGEVPKAFVVKKNPDLTELQVEEYVKDRMAPYKWLNGGVEFVNGIPKSPSGKILRRFLRDQEKTKREQNHLSKL